MIGDVVLLLKEKLPCGQWRVGRISQLIRGRDQVVRSAKIKTSSKKLLHRALNMLYPIECLRLRHLKLKMILALPMRIMELLQR